MSYIDDFASNTFPSQPQMITRRYLAFYFPWDPNYLSINPYKSNNIDNGIFMYIPYIYNYCIYISLWYPYKSLYIHAYFQWDPSPNHPPNHPPNPTQVEAHRQRLREDRDAQQAMGWTPHAARGGPRDIGKLDEIGDFTNTNWGKWEIIGMQVMDIDVGYIPTIESTWINNINVSVWRQKLNVLMRKLCLSNHQICGYPNTPQFHASPLHWVYIGIYIGHYSHLFSLSSYRIRIQL